MNEPRCFDCFEEFTADAPRFAVLKKMRDIEPTADAAEPASFFHSAQFDPVLVCRACAGWYGDEALVWSDGSDAGDGRATGTALR